MGPLWIASIVGAVVAMSGVRASLRATLKRVYWSTSAILTICAAILANRVWESLYGPRLVFDPAPLGASLLDGLNQLPRVLLEQIGVFDYLEFGMPSLSYTLWTALAVAVSTIAILVGNRRQRWFLTMLCGAVLALPVLMVAATMRHTGFGLQGRYVLPFSIIVPLSAGEVLVRRYERLQALDAERLFLPFTAVAAVVQLVAWWTNAQRFAVGVGGPIWFVKAAEWRPPFGWWPWLLLALGGVSLSVTTALCDVLFWRRDAGSIAERDDDRGSCADRRPSNH
jgi:hypothetical protein